jgi:hypothetical protein
MRLAIQHSTPIVFEISPQDTIKHLKKIVQYTIGIPYDLHVLTYKQMNLQDSRSVESYAIHENEILKLSIISKDVLGRKKKVSTNQELHKHSKFRHLLYFRSLTVLNEE